MLPDKNFQESLENTLELAPVDPLEQTIVHPEIVPEDMPEDNDFNNDSIYAKNNLEKLINTGINAINELSEIARDSQTPRSYEVLATLMKTVGEMNTNILNIHKLRHDIAPKNKKPSEINVDKAVIFTGSTRELIKAIKESQEEYDDTN